LLVDYVRLLAPPAKEDLPSDAAADSVAIGSQVFVNLGCATCHVPELETGPHDVGAFAHARVMAYSDFLLHDLGPGLADVCGPNASPGEYRTAPLWGLRHRRRYLHDGRAANLSDAVAAHGGEGERSANGFAGLDGRERGMLLRFLRSL
jgi:CxxC motif-containing protein (DUF1111 family)